MRIMHGICEEYDIPFISFMAPNLLLSDKLEGIANDICKTMPYKEIRLKVQTFYHDIYEKTIQFDWIMDISNLLDNNEGTYFDLVHIIDKRNEYVARTIFNILIKKMLVEK